MRLHIQVFNGMIGAPFIILSFYTSNLLRTEGFAKAFMVGTILGAVVNMVLDPVFISLLWIWGSRSCNRNGHRIYMCRSLFSVVFTETKPEIVCKPCGISYFG